MALRHDENQIDNATELLKVSDPDLKSSIEKPRLGEPRCHAVGSCATPSEWMTHPAAEQKGRVTASGPVDNYDTLPSRYTTLHAGNPCNISTASAPEVKHPFPLRAIAPVCQVAADAGLVLSR